MIIATTTMNTAAREWAALVAARNEIETAKAARAEARRPDMEQQVFDWTGGGAALKLTPMSARPLTQEQRDLRDSALGMTLGLYR